jgi:hypothetical protein
MVHLKEVFPTHNYVRYKKIQSRDTPPTPEERETNKKSTTPVLCYPTRFALPSPLSTDSYRIELNTLRLLSSFRLGTCAGNSEIPSPPPFAVLPPPAPPAPFAPPCNLACSSVGISIGTLANARIGTAAGNSAWPGHCPFVSCSSYTGGGDLSGGLVPGPTGKRFLRLWKKPELRVGD